MNNKTTRETLERKKEQLNSSNIIADNHTIMNESRSVSFQSFVAYVKSLDLHPAVNWKSQLRKESYENLTKKRRIISKELQQIDYQDPLSLISSLYQHDNYSYELFGKAVDNLNDLFSQDTVIDLIEKKERLEMIRKIIEYYLHYITINYSDKIISSFKRLQPLEESVANSYNLIHASSGKMKVIKSHFISASMKLALRHNKSVNLKTMIKFLKDTLLIQIEQIEQLELGTMSYINYYKKNINLQNTLSKILSEYPLIVIIDILKGKCREKNERFIKLFLNDIETLFNTKKNNIYDLFCLYSINSHVGISKESLQLFAMKILRTYKNKLKNSIKRTFYTYADDKRNLAFEDIKSIKDVKKLKFEEGRFLECFKSVLLQLKQLAEMYISYSQIPEKSEWAIMLQKEIDEKKEIAYTCIEKTLSKLTLSINFVLRSFGNKCTMLMILDMICLFEEQIKLEMGINYSKFLPLSVKNLILDQIKFDNIKNIKKIGILLSGDIWQKTELEDSFDLFSIEKIEEKTPLFLKNYLTMFNNVSSYVNKENISALFNKCFKTSNEYINNFTSASLASVTINDFYMPDVMTVSPLSTPLSISKLILSSSTISIIRALFDLVLDLIFYDSIVFEIFFQIFNIIDYFMLSSFNMFIINKTKFNSIFEVMNYEEVKQRGKIESASVQTRFQLAYPNFRRFLIATKKKLEVLFQQKDGIDLEKNCCDFDNAHDMNGFYLPKLNSIILDSDGNYNNNTSYDPANMTYEALLLLETMHSIYKILKRLTHFNTKIELDFQSGFITDTINQYKVIIGEMKEYMYYHLASELFQIEPIQTKINAFKWDPDESEGEDMLFEASPFINDIIIELTSVHTRLDKIKRLSLKVQKHFYTVVIKYIVNRVMDCFAKLKRCNSTGRSIMLKDLKFFKQSLEELVNKTWSLSIDCNVYFNEIFTYVNSWYSEKDEMINYLFDNNMQYKYWIGLMNTSPVVKELSWSQKRELTQKMEERYYEMLKREIEELNDD